MLLFTGSFPFGPQFTTTHSHPWVLDIIGLQVLAALSLGDNRSTGI